MTPKPLILYLMFVISGTAVVLMSKIGTSTGRPGGMRCSPESWVGSRLNISCSSQAVYFQSIHLSIRKIQYIWCIA